jgi:hypothetical protein
LETVKMIPANAISAPVRSIRSQAEQHDDFLPIKAIVERYARFAFRHLPPSEAEEATCESITAAFTSFVRLKARGRDPVREFPGRMAHWATRVVMDGRHLSGTDALSPRAQRRHKFRVESICQLNRRSARERQARSGRQAYADDIEEQLYENARTSPSELAVFKIDFANWLAARNHQDRQMIHELSQGDRTSDLAQKYGITPGRVSQKRRQFHDAWQEFQGEQPVDVHATVA